MTCEGCDLVNDKLVKSKVVMRMLVLIETMDANF
jgi:hypothetical protein